MHIPYRISIDAFVFTLGYQQGPRDETFGW